MYCTTPSGTRYQTGSPRSTRLRQSVEEMASAGISTMVTRSDGRLRKVASSIWCPGRVQPTKCANSNTSPGLRHVTIAASASAPRSEEHTSELQSRGHLVCRLLLEKKKA